MAFVKIIEFEGLSQGEDVFRAVIPDERGANRLRRRFRSHIAVAGQVIRVKKRDVNTRFMAMTGHYIFGPDFCNPAAGWEKGQVEKNVRDARHRFWREMPSFPDLDTLNIWLEQRCQALWVETAHGSMPGSIADVWEAEKPALMPLPTAFDGYFEQSKRVSPTCLITFDRNRYSVPASFANRPVSLHIYPERLVVVAEGHVICEHQRIIERSHRQPGRVCRHVGH